LARATIDLGMKRAADVTLARILRSDRFHANLALLAVASLALAGIGVSSVANDSMAIWFNRNVLLGDREWPQDVHLVVEGVEDGRLTIPRGDDWPLVVTVRDDSRRLPKVVHVDFRGRSERWSEPLARSGARRFETIWRNVLEPFEFRARTGRASTPWITVALVDRPRVEQLHLAATSPTYAGGNTEPLPLGKGPYYVLEGSTLEVRGVANKPLSQATLVVAGARREMTIAGDRDFRASVPVDEGSAGVYRVELADTEQLTLPGASEPGPLWSTQATSFTLEIKPDSEPRVLAEVTGVSSLIVPGARVPWHCRIHDDYAVTAARLHYRWHGENDDGGEDGVERLEQIDGLPGRRAVSLQSALELPRLRIPAGSQLSFSIEADDNDDVSGPKSGRSSTFVLRVVSEDELRTDLLRREREHRIELERGLKHQEDVSTECEAMLAGVQGKARLETGRRQLLVKLERRQKLLGTNVAALAGRFQGIIAEIQNNRLEEENGPLQSRLRDRIVDPMWTLADDAIPRAARQLDEAWRLSTDAARRDRTLSDAITTQQSILAAMRQILTHLVKVEGYQQAVNLLYETQRAQKDVLDLTEAERQKRIREILSEADEVPDNDRGARK
jgi:hypothetical protein